MRGKWDTKGAKEVLASQEKLLAKKQEQQKVDDDLVSSLNDMAKHGIKLNKAQKEHLKNSQLLESI